MVDNGTSVNFSYSGFNAPADGVIGSPTEGKNINVEVAFQSANKLTSTVIDRETYLYSFGVSQFVPIITKYIMRGKDVDCGSVTYRVWVVQDEPDISGAQYSGPKCGASPFTDIVILLKYT